MTYNIDSLSLNRFNIVELLLSMKKKKYKILNYIVYIHTYL